MALTVATVLSRSFFLATLILAAQWLPLFDASPKLEYHRRTWLTRPLLRWDTFHFEGIATQGYTYEHQWAFLTGTPLLLRLFSNDFAWTVAVLLVTYKTSQAIHQLTLHHFPQSPAFARLVTFLSLLSSSPATLLFAPYAEPFFTYLSYQGMLYAAQERWLHTCVVFALATSFRSNGILLSGYIVWGLVFRPFLEENKCSIRKCSMAILLSLISCSPFLYHNYLAYLAFCSAGSATPLWCSQIPPSIYTHAQAKYWNVGFLKYWTISQIPNFILALPPLLLMIVFSVRYVRTQVNLYTSQASLTWHISILPHVLHTVFLCLTLIFFSHTQIVLRLAPSLPTLYWAAGGLFVEPEPGKRYQNPFWPHAWVWWSCAWGLLSVGLWVAFLPPA